MNSVCENVISDSENRQCVYDFIRNYYNTLIDDMINLTLEIKTLVKIKVYK